jgi:hypothetical protein
MELTVKMALEHVFSQSSPMPHSQLLMTESQNRQHQWQINTTSVRTSLLTSPITELKACKLNLVASNYPVP